MGGRPPSHRSTHRPSREDRPQRGVGARDDRDGRRGLRQGGATPRIHRRAGVARGPSPRVVAQLTPGRWITGHWSPRSEGQPHPRPAIGPSGSAPSLRLWSAPGTRPRRLSSTASAAGRRRGHATRGRDDKNREGRSRTRLRRLRPQGRRVFETARELAIQLQKQVLSALPEADRDRFLDAMELIADACAAATERTCTKPGR